MPKKTYKKTPSKVVPNNRLGWAVLSTANLAKTSPNLQQSSIKLLIVRLMYNDFDAK